MDEKAQTSLEYLLIIVGAIFVVTTVSIYIKTTAQSATQAIKDINQ
ncbi:MAG: hypothetical protein PHX27_00520 [Candidatus ainarchaeum sp.]|nr:hypothetical protein [Candidatus ainarchaeum sp.]